VFSINIPDIIARLGSLKVQADFLVGTGVLESPGDARIDIENHSPFYLTINNLVIPTGAGGDIQFNDVPITVDPADINKDIRNRNNIPSYATGLSNTQAQFSSIVTATTTPAPVITVHTDYNPNFDAVNTFPPGYQKVAPDITVVGTIKNI